MAGIPEIRKQIVAAEREFAVLGARLRQEQLALAEELRTGANDAANTRRQAIAALEQQRATMRTRLETIRKSLDAARRAAIAATPADDPVGALDPGVPIVFFPVRLETRFRAAGAGKELVIRVFPDDIHIDTHEPELTAEEVVRGRLYWTQVWRSGTGTDESKQREGQAWAQLADFSGPERAAWVARSLEPINLTSRPGTPTPDETPLPVAPDFPALPEKESSWTRAPYTAVLPDRWIAIAFTSGGRLLAVGDPIPDRLAVGPSPNVDTPPQPGDALSLIDEEMRWLIDLEAAFKVGMALRMPLPATVTSINRLFVFGVKGTMSPDESSNALAALLDAHHYTRGLSFLPRGTPTNNTSSAPSGYGTRDPGHERSFATERQGPLFKPGSGAAGDLASRAFGVPADVFANCWRAGDPDDALAADLHTVLWPGTWGYYLEKRLPGFISDPDLANFRTHFIRYVRGGGPLAAVRIRNQPYGLLPMTPLDLWAPIDSNDVSGRAVTILHTVQDPYVRAISAVPRMGKTSDPDQDLISVLRMNAVGVNYAVRNMVGPMHVYSFFRFCQTGELNAEWWRQQAAAARVNVGLPGLPPNTPQATSLFSVNLTSIDDKPLLAGTATQDYLASLAGADVTTLRSNTILQAGKRPVLYDLARHGLLLSIAGAAYRMQARAGLITPPERVEPELIDIDPEKETLTTWRQLERKIANVTGDQPLRAYLDDPAHESNPDAADLAAVRASLRRLASAPAEKLELCLREALDTASHRFDAWATSLATRRLEFVRGRRPTGAWIGSYGWVENILPAPAPRSDGYIQTPSPSHATAAAVLASGYLAHRGSAGPNPFAIDLTSGRVKLAARLIEGVRTGQPIGAILGYQIEREMHDLNLSQYVAPFRNIAPLASTPAAPQQISEAIAANNVVHGLRLLDLWKNHDPKFDALRTSVNIADFQRIDALLTRFADQVDALGDIILTENVYQLAEGNYDRGALSMSAVIAGQNIPEPEVLRTPRTGTALSHRVLTLIDPRNFATSGWTTDSMQARAAAEPCANAWAASMMGQAAKIRCRVRYTAGGVSREMRLADLKLSPLDAVYATVSSGAGRNSELEQRLAYVALRTRPADVPANAEVTLDYSRDPQWTPDILSFDEFLAVAASIRAILPKARPLMASDLAPHDDNLPHAIDAAELKGRADAAVTALRNAATRLKQALNAAGTPLEGLRTALVRLSYLGFPNAIPISAVDGSPNDARLANQARALLVDAGERTQKLDAMAAAFKREGATEEALLEFDTDRLHVVFGNDFQVLPRFTPPNPAEITTAFQNSDALQRNRRIESTTWFTRAARVRENLGRLADVLRLSEALGRPAAALTVGQMPFVPGEAWVALPSAAPLPGGRLSLVACGPVPAETNVPLAGLAWDEWSEVVPNRTETTGMAFHYDRPNSRSPQAILLAVPPNDRPWNLLWLEQLFRETFTLCQIRLVDQDAMLELDHFLPALCFPINAADDTIGVDLRAN
jgi:hypothetical protein